jgi:hypothetical protein
MSTPEPLTPDPEAEARQRRWEEWSRRLRPLGGQAGRDKVEELVALDPEHAQEHWDRWNTIGIGKTEVKEMVAELRKPRLPKVEGVAERANRQSTEQLFAKHEQEVRKAKAEWDRAAKHNAQALEERRRAAYDPDGAARLRHQAMIDHWGEAQRFAAEAERKLRADLDPCNLGLYGIHGTLYGRDGR